MMIAVSISIKAVADDSFKEAVSDKVLLFQMVINNQGEASSPSYDLVVKAAAFGKDSFRGEAKEIYRLTVRDAVQGVVEKRYFIIPGKDLVSSLLKVTQEPVDHFHITVKLVRDFGMIEFNSSYSYLKLYKDGIFQLRGNRTYVSKSQAVDFKGINNKSIKASVVLMDANEVNFSPRKFEIINSRGSIEYGNALD